MALVSGGRAFHAKAPLYNTLFINNVLCGWEYVCLMNMFLSRGINS